MLKKLKELIKKLLEKLGFRKEAAPKEEKPEEEAIPVPKEDPKEEPEEDKRFADPKKSNPKANIPTFLWKPESDNAPHNPVVVVACDEVRNEDLKCKIYGQNGKLLENLSGSSTGRANGLPGFKYGRIHFRPSKSDKQLKKRAPLKIEFCLPDGSIIKIRNRKDKKVKDPTKRIDLR